MSTSLLTTKLYVPPLRPNLVRRPHLTQRLNEALHQGHRLTLVSAPAGFGKTTLLSAWIQQIEGRVGWISLDKDDNDPARFWAYFVAALQRVQPDIGKAAWAELQSSQSPAAVSGSHSEAKWIKLLLTDLINEISGISQPLVLILDDFHVITEQNIHDALVFILDNMSPQMHLVLSSRADPPWPLARLRARGQMAELHAKDLRFSLNEVIVFLKESMELDLSLEEVAALEDRTEGWIAGLQMAAVSMRGRKDLSDFVQAFTGSNRFVLDYLAEEVLQRQPDSVQAFLLQTSILDRLSGPLCDAVLDSHESGIKGRDLLSASDPQFSSQQILEYLDSHNLFLVPLDDKREWYRYHRLFADLLRKRLHQLQPDIVAELHRRASTWYERRATSHGEKRLMSSAIEHAFAAEDFERAADLITQTTETTFKQSHVVTFLNWVDRLPHAVLRTHPHLVFNQAFARLMTGYSLDAVEAGLQDVDEDMDFGDSGLVTIDAFKAASRGQMSKAIELSQQALQWLPEDDVVLRSLVTWILNLSQSADSDLNTQSQATDEVVRLGRQTGNVTIAVMALCHQGALRLRQGRLHEAKEIYDQALALATDELGQTLPVGSEAMMGLGELYREWNNLETATRQLEVGIELSKQWRPIAAMNAYISLARVRQVRGDADGAQEAIQQVGRLVERFDTVDWDTYYVALHEARLWLAQGKIGQAWQWVKEQGFDQYVSQAEPAIRSNIVSRRLRKYEQMLLARVLLAQNRAAETLALLELLQPEVERQGRTGLVIEILVLKALALSQTPGREKTQGGTEHAMIALESALSLAEPEGYVRLFLDEGELMGDLLQEAAARGIAVGYVNRLLDALRSELGDTRRPVESLALTWVEPLSEREVEVLQLIATGLSNREIAEKLVVAVSTVKTHVHNIFSKLNVSKRTQAVARARELKLI